MLARTLYESNMQLANSILRLSFHHNFFHHCNSYVLLSLKRNLVGLQKPFPWPVIGISVERKPDPENFYPNLHCFENVSRSTCMQKTFVRYCKSGERYLNSKSKITKIKEAFTKYL